MDDITTSNFNMNKTLMIAAIGCGIAGFLLSIGRTFSPPSPSPAAWFFYPLGSLIYGMTVLYAFGQFIPSMLKKRNLILIIAIGTIASVVLDLVISQRVYYVFLIARLFPFVSFTIWDFFWIIGFPIIMGIVAENTIKWFGEKAFLYWLLANVFTIIFYSTLPKFTLLAHPEQIPALVVAGVVGAVISGVTGCYLTLKEMQKDTQKLVAPVSNNNGMWTKVSIAVIIMGCIGLIWAIFTYSSTQAPAPKHTSIAGLVPLKEIDFVGVWEFDHKAQWIKITEAGQAFQCRIDQEGTVFRSEGVLIKGNQIVWQDIWGVYSIQRDPLSIVVNSNGKVTKYDIAHTLMESVCELPF